MYIAVKGNKHLTIMEKEIGHYAGLGYAIHAIGEGKRQEQSPCPTVEDRGKEKQPRKPAKKTAGEKAP